MKKWVLATQYGAWWSFSPSEWLAFCRQVVAQGGGYDLGVHNRLKAVPYDRVKSVRGMAATSKKWHIRIVRPLNFSYSDWQDEVKEYEAVQAVKGEL